jgi:hypothetical protein
MAKKTSINLPPGVLKGESMLGSAGRYTASNNVRWVNGRPQKVGGNEALTDEAVEGHIRGLHAWGDNTGSRQFLAMGTAYGLWTVSTQDYTPVDITPYESIRTAGNNPLATTSGSPTVTVTLTGHGAEVGDLVNFSGASAVGGLTIDGNYTVVTAPTADTFTITAADNASSTATGGGAAVVVSIILGDGEENISTGFGWGVGGWGESTWGTAREVSSILNYPRAWALDNFGKILLANVVDGGLYAWDPTETPTPRAEVVTDAPTQAAFMFVTSDRIVFLLGTNTGGTLNRMQVHSSGQGTYDDWDYVATTSTADGAPSRIRTLQKGTRLIAGCDLGSLLSLIWSDEAAYVFQYIGNSTVFQSRLVGENCGIVGPDAFCSVGGIAYWLGNDRFWLYNGSVTEIPNQDDIKEWLIGQMRPAYGVKAVSWFNERFNEVWFGVVPEGEDEVTMAAVWMRANGRWFICDIERTAATRFSGDNTSVILAGHDGILYAHDVGVDDDGAALDWYLETSVLELEDGDLIYEVQGVHLDMQKRTGDVTVTLTGYEESDPEAEAIDSETIVIPQGQGSEDARTTARLVKMRLEGSGVGCDFRMGVPKIEITAVARR